MLMNPPKQKVLGVSLVELLQWRKKNLLGKLNSKSAPAS
jgi:hypothetical protein